MMHIGSHAEVIGLTGQVDDDVTVVEGFDDLTAVDFNRPIYLLSQTTQSIELFNHLGEMEQQTLYGVWNTFSYVSISFVVREYNQLGS